MNFPIDMTGWEVSKKTNMCETVIDQFAKIQKVSDKTFARVPIFKLIPNWKNVLDIYPDLYVLVDFDFYEAYALESFPVYVSTDRADKRPFILTPPGKIFTGGTTKRFLIDLIINPAKGIEVVYKDNDFYNLKSNNIDMKPVNNEPIITSAPTITPPKEEIIELSNPIISSEEKEAFKEVFKEDNIEEAEKIIDEARKTIELNEEIAERDKIIKMILARCKDNPSFMEKKLLNDEIITSIDAAKDMEFKWEGVVERKNIKNTTYSVKIKNQTFGTFAHPLDAARKYNDIIIKYNLPYPLNNIPGFLELSLDINRRRMMLNEYDTWELAAELNRRLTPKDLKGF
jgi:hypothetical protein